ncbi:MAG: DUF2169 domain-containing protein [Polyangiaceae bacterium]|nr:DUF2169 domain-containing protein [Polyangiaceae bacterium]
MAGVWSGSWPVRVAPVGLVAVGSVLWRFKGQLRATVIVKATFTFPVQGMMTRTNPQPLRRADDYLSGLPSLHGACEIAPRMDDAGVVVVGHAYAPGGATGRQIRFTLVRATEILVDKTLYVYGDRSRGGQPAVFEKMRVGYERAYGGIELPANPIGVGCDKKSHAAPNIIDPKNPKRGVGGFGPIPARFLARRTLRGSVAPDLMERGIATYPDDFAWDYFQSAPNDQRVPRLRGDEWLMVEGMHPRHPRLRAGLPKARAYARVYAERDVGAPDLVELKADMLHVEPDAERCSLVWRGDFPVASELAADHLILAGGVQVGDEGIPWPAEMEPILRMSSTRVVAAELPGAADDDLQDTADKNPAGRRPRPAPPPPPVPDPQPSFIANADRTAPMGQDESWPPPPPPSARGR